jgi:hypothetical protein
MQRDVGASFDEVAVDEGGAGADEGDKVGCVVPDRGLHHFEGLVRVVGGEAPG